MMAENVKYSVRVVDTGEEYECSREQTLLKAMVLLGRCGIPSGCHGGGCGVCKVRVLSGRTRASLMSRAHVSEAEEADGYVLACRASPLSDVVIEVVGGMRKGFVRRYGFV